MCVGDAQDEQDDTVCASASGRNFFFCDVVGPYSAACSAEGSWNTRAFATTGRGFLMTKALAAASSTCSGWGCHSIANGSIAMVERIDY